MFYLSDFISRAHADYSNTTKFIARGKTEAAPLLVRGENNSDSRSFAWWQPVDWAESKLIPSQDMGKSHGSSVARIRAKFTQI